MARQMKDSGIAWIGEIPSHWQRVKTLYALEMPITDGPHETPELFDDGIPFVSAEAVSCGNGSIDFDHIRGFISEEYYNECCKKYVPAMHDILMIKSGATTGKVAVVDTARTFTIWSPLAVFRFNSTVSDYQYMFYYLQSDAYQKQIENKWTFGTQQNIGMRTLEQLLLCLPPIDEQHRIAAFLDRRCAEIDAVMERTKATIEEYKKLKQAVITEAVTKGVRGPRPMKDSGIEWIGEIPEGWEVLPHKYVMHKEKSICEHYAGEDIISLTMNGVIVRDLTAGGKMPTTFDGYQYVEPDDMLLCLFDIDVTPRCVGIVRNHGVTSPAYSRFKVHVGYYNAYYDYLLRFIDDEKVFIHLSKNLRSSLTETDFGAIKTISPSYDEQVEIAAYLDEKCAALDTLIAKKSALLTELEAYKKSLIYEYVTGKKEVPACP
ncbi:MAG: restriction endonuclease subunit S [Eubacteriales bacterium]|nr:restriction endonuclease subunit S [Eubacteriales bacterium]